MNTPDEEAVQLIELIVERCREDGQLVTVHQHWPFGAKAVELGFSLMLGAISAIGLLMGLRLLVEWLWGMIP